jgi:DNA-binding MarR family transcriptional regulator
VAEVLRGQVLVRTPPSPRDRELAEALVAAVGGFRRATRRAASVPTVRRLTTSQVELLLLLRERPGLSVVGAAEELRLAANSVSTLVRTLVDEGLVDRRPDAQDRRVVRLQLTDAASDRLLAWQDRRIDAVALAIHGASGAVRERVASTAAVLEMLAERLART